MLIEHSVYPQRGRGDAMRKVMVLLRKLLCGRLRQSSPEVALVRDASDRELREEGKDSIRFTSDEPTSIIRLPISESNK